MFTLFIYKVCLHCDLQFSPTFTSVKFSFLSRSVDNLSICNLLIIIEYVIYSTCRHGNKDINGVHTNPNVFILFLTFSGDEPTTEDTDFRQGFIIYFILRYFILLIKHGAVGRVLSSTLYSGTSFYSSNMAQSYGRRSNMPESS